MQSIPSDRASKHTFWQRQVTQFGRSKVSSAAQFCREQGLPYKSFKNWQRKFEAEPVAPQPKPKSFVRIQAPSPKSSTIKCRLPNGLELSWDATTPAPIISAVIQEVGQL